MKRGSRIVVGIVLLALIVGGVLIYEFVIRRGGSLADIGGSGEVVSVSGLIGTEKNNFLNNEEVQRILRRRYGLEVDFRGAGSIEMIDMDHTGIDFLWPSSEVAVELYQLRGGTARSRVIFNSPIVMYSWPDVVAALMEQGIVEVRDNAYFVSDFAGLVQLALSDTGWRDIGLDLFGRVTITSTDPTQSNSGSMFSGLVANILFGDVVAPAQLPEVLPDLLEVFRRQGRMEHSTGTLFRNYLERGMGAFPLVVGYENQIVEFSLQNPELWERAGRDRLRVLYPVPTVWSSHPLIALTESGRLLTEALEDEEIQDLAWTQHGFRTGLAGIDNDPGALGIDGIPRDITQIMRMPQPEVMQAIIDALES